jgi:hypothetical protein
MTHLIITLGNGQRIDRWTDTPEITEDFYRGAGAYVFEGGEPQPVVSDNEIDTCSAFPSRR